MLGAVLTLILIVLVLILGAIGATIGKIDAIQKAKPPATAACSDSFTHEFTTIGAKRLPHPEFGEKVITTLVLKWCGRCKNHIVIPFSGDWSLDDFLRKESEVDELNRMAGKDSGK